MKSLYLPISNFTAKKNKNQLEIVVKASYGLHPNKCFQILNLTFRRRSLMTRRFEICSNCQGRDEIRDK